MIVLVTGGSGSGKSAFAEDRVLSFGEARRIYIATMYPFDMESKKRVHRHRNMRAGKGFETVECYTNLKELLLPSDSVVLLECMSNLVANEMFQKDGAGEDTVKEILEGISEISKNVRHLVIVTNEIFSEATAYEGEKIGQGRENAKAYLTSHPEVMEELDRKVRQHYHLIEGEEEVKESDLKLTPKEEQMELSIEGEE